VNIDTHWQHRSLLSYLLYPLSFLFRLLAALRRWSYRSGIRHQQQFSVPILIVGNITVGGSGKTPLVIWLVDHLRGLGLKPGVVSRGYGGKAEHWPQQVRADSDPATVGDEAVLLAQRASCPVCVGPDRPAAIDALLKYTDCDIVVSDDGMQHYAMARDLEIAVIDGKRRFGNGWLLPAGPLREPVSRLKSVDLIVCNGQPEHGEFAMKLRQPQLVALFDSGEQVQDLSLFDGKHVSAIAGIGNPQRFFDMLQQHGIVLDAHAFPDHHPYQANDLDFVEQLPLLMTEKDAVKCRRLIDKQRPAWVVRVEAQPDAAFVHRINLALTDIRAKYAKQ